MIPQVMEGQSLSGREGPRGRRDNFGAREGRKKRIIIEGKASETQQARSISHRDEAKAKSQDPGGGETSFSTVPMLLGVVAERASLFSSRTFSQSVLLPTQAPPESSMLASPAKDSRYSLRD